MILPGLAYALPYWPHLQVSIPLLILLLYLTEYYYQQALIHQITAFSSLPTKMSSLFTNINDINFWLFQSATLFTLPNPSSIHANFKYIFFV